MAPQTLLESDMEWLSRVIEVVDMPERVGSQHEAIGKNP